MFNSEKNKLMKSHLWYPFTHRNQAFAFAAGIIKPLKILKSTKKRKKGH